MSVFRSGLFSGKVAIVTGGGTGIGKAIATELLHLGCKVVIASRNLERLTKAAESLEHIGEIKPMQCNIRKEDDVKSTVTKILEDKNLGKIDFLINNGGGQFPSMTHNMTLKGWNAVIETNLTGTFLMSKEVFNQHMAEHGGVITNIIAVQVERGFPLMGHTGAARAAVQNLTKTMAIEWIANGVRVNAVSPGTIFSQTASDNYAIDVFQMAIPHIPAKRLGTPAEISSAVCYLNSPAAAYITGTTLNVDGGSSLYSPPLVPVEDHDKMPAYEWTPKSNL